MFNRNTIAYISELKFLGLFITENFPCHVPVHSFCAGLGEVYYTIKSLTDIIYTHMLWSIYYAYFCSRLKYDIMFGVEITKVLCGNKMPTRCNR
jgi:hypothetical protein